METPFIIWTEALAVGHESLDAEHRRLVQAINGINAAIRVKQTPTQLKPLLYDLKSLAEDHSKHENSALLKINFSPIPSPADRHAFLKAMVDADVAAHVDGHARSLSNLDGIIHDFHSAIDSLQWTLSLRLNKWFGDHVDKHERRLKAVFQALSRQAADDSGGPFGNPA